MVHQQNFTNTKNVLLKTNLPIEMINEIMKYSCEKDYKTLYLNCLKDFMNKIETTKMFYYEDDERIMYTGLNSIGCLKMSYIQYICKLKTEYLFRYNASQIPENITILQPIDMIFYMFFDINFIFETISTKIYLDRITYF